MMIPNLRIKQRKPTIVLGLLLFLATAYLVASMIGYAIQAENVSLQGGSTLEPFSLLGNNRHRPIYHDMKWLTVVAECGTKEENLFIKKPVCMAFGYGADGGGYPESQYPPMINWILRLLNVSSRYTGILALSFGTGFIAALLLWSRRAFQSIRAWSFWLSICLLSFPVQAVLERGNLDSVVFLFIVAAAYLLSRHKALPMALASFFVFMSVALKIFPAPGFMGWSAFNQPANSNQSQATSQLRSAILAVCILGLACSVPFIMHDPPIAEFGGGRFSFGLSALSHARPPLINLLGIRMAGWIMLILAAMKIFFLAFGAACTFYSKLDAALWEHMSRVPQLNLRRFNQSLFSIMGWSWLSGYILTVGYDYKHIFLLPPFLLLLGALERSSGLNSRQKLLGWMVALAALCILYLPFGFTVNPRSHQPFFAVAMAEFMSEIILLPIIAGSLASILSGSLIRSYACKLSR